MGTWGPGIFENDYALDWIAELADSADDTPLIDALNTVIDQIDESPVAQDCAVAITAAEVVAAWMGEPSEDCPEEVETWVEGRPAPSATMISQARYVTEAVLENSELKDLWKNSDEFDKWQEGVEDLLPRLAC
ncbi:DUF4259 domain-containing protein [Acaryochloris marina NIES-2412]|uniref:DUF4259 domain-containing protein n=1 Tax=Acaryochloris marina TaxID=155978 RepID=UPI00405A40DC